MFPRDKQINKEDINELYFLTPTENLPSILKNGILSHNLIEQLEKQHEFHRNDVSNPSVQGNQRHDKTPQVGAKTYRPLHSYANMFMNPQNTMVNLVATYEDNPSYRGDACCIIRISKRLLEKTQDGHILLTNRNAAKNDASFFKPSNFQLSKDESRCISSDDPAWCRGPGKAERPEHITIRSAEVLKLNRVKPKYFIGIFVPADTTLTTVTEMCNALDMKHLSLSTNPTVFQRGGGFVHLARYQIAPTPAALQVSDDSDSELDDLSFYQP